MFDVIFYFDITLCVGQSVSHHLFRHLYEKYVLFTSIRAKVHESELIQDKQTHIACCS